VALVIIDVSEERNASIIKMTRIGELETTLVVTSNRSALGFYTLMFGAIYSSETSVLTSTIRRHIVNDGITHSYRLENPKILFSQLPKTKGEELS
jgi:hypothetical protein